MWNKFCGNVLIEYLKELKHNKIAYFILRNHQGLPFENTAKDIDIVIEPKQIKAACQLLRKVFLNNDLEYYDEFRTSKMICMHGMSMKSNTGIHIDLLQGLNIKGYELEKFDRMLEHTEDYRGIVVLEDKYEAFWLYICKLFGQKKPIVKLDYQEKIKFLLKNNSDFFIEELSKRVSKSYLQRVKSLILAKNYDAIIKDSKLLNKEIKKNVRRTRPIKTLSDNIQFLLEKLDRIVFRYNKYSRTIGMIAPDGAGKSSLLEEIKNSLNYYYVSEDKCRFYHFRPTIVPNLNEVGKKIKITKESIAETDREQIRQSGPVISLIRIIYYSMDYIVGWRKQIRADVHYDKYSVFDRYSYDMIVDPKRSKIKLPYWVRRFFVALTPKPKVMFCLIANPETIYRRKQELSLKEIERQLGEYKKLKKIYPDIYFLDAEKSINVLCDEAMKILLDNYAKQ